MSEQSLRAVAEEIRQLTDEGSSDEAIARAQSLLRRFPRYLRAYSLLGEAALDQEMPDEAGEIFHRVLSADPESFVAHAGLGLIYAHANRLDEALWHMTRAWELEPGMPEIRAQLRQLYQRRDGRAPARLDLNRVALARTYLRNGRHDHAVQELAGALEAEPERADLQIALAEAQWHAGRRHRAVVAANTVLASLPYCLKANLLLGQFYAEEAPESASPYWAIVEELDPEHEQAVALFGEASYLKAVAVAVPSIDVAASASPGTGADEVPGWLSDLPIFASEPDEQELDWDAIIAYETDWRTLLGAATHRAIDEFRPNWQVELRRATQLRLRDRDAGPPPAPQPPGGGRQQQAASATGRPAPATNARAPMQSPSVNAVSGHSGNGANGKGASQTSAALIEPAWQAVAEAQPALAWHQPLRSDTRATLAARPNGQQQWEPPPPTGRPAGGAKMETAPLWRPGLYFATLTALSRYDKARATQTFPPVPAPTPEARGAVATFWRDVLRHASRVALDAVPQANEAWDDNHTQWSSAEEQAPPLPVALWVQALRESTAVLLTMQPTPAPADAWANRLRSETRAALLALPQAPAQPSSGSVTPQWAEQLRAATEAALSVQTEEPAKGIAERVTEAAGSVVQQAREVAGTLADSEVVHRAREIAEGVADSEAAHKAREIADSVVESDAVQRAREAAESVRRRAMNTLSSLLHREQAEALESGSPSASLLLREEESAVPTRTVEDDLADAGHAWEGGRNKDAYAIYQRLSVEGSVTDPVLVEAVSAWTTRQDAPAMAFQLLGDTYRRMGKMQQAATCYREVINRM